MIRYVNKDSLIESLMQRFGMKKKEATDIVNQIFEEMSQALINEGTVEITGFGKFIIFDRKSRMGINPVTKERMEIPATKLPKFKPSQTLKNRCNRHDVDDSEDEE